MSSLLSKFVDKPPHALLIVGQGRKQALDFALTISEVKTTPHPDIHQYFPEGKTGMHGISSIRALLQEVTLSPFEAKKKCFIIHDAERMLPSSSNALLKVIEEPPHKTHFLLLTSEKEKMLPTIRSRCQILFFSSENKTLTPLQQSFTALLNDFSSEKLDEITKTIDESKKEMEKGLLAAMPSELTSYQKEAYEKEIEGQIALKHQEDFYSLLDLLLNHHVKKNGIDSFEQIHSLVKKGKLAFERHLSTKFILESVFTYLN